MAASRAPRRTAPAALKRTLRARGLAVDACRAVCKQRDLPVQRRDLALQRRDITAVLRR